MYGAVLSDSVSVFKLVARPVQAEKYRITEYQPGEMVLL